VNCTGTAGLDGAKLSASWKTCGGLAVDLVYPPPHRPTLDSDEAMKPRTEIVESIGALISKHDTGKLPVIVRCRPK
jgi:hypothetical protein